MSDAVQRLAAVNTAQIDVRPGQLAATVQAAIGVLRETGVAIYDRGGALVRPVRASELSPTDGIRRDDGALLLRPVTGDWLRLRLAEAASWVRSNKDGTHRSVDPPADLARIIAETPDEGAWPPLRTIARHPVLWPDGTWCGRSGYARGLLVDATGEWPAPGETSAEAEDALSTLRRLLRHYEWASPADESVALALLLTAVMRPVIDVAPLIAIDAPTAGSGKSLLVDSAAILATGARASVLDVGRDPDEAAKRLDTMLLAGDPVIALDNIIGALGGATLCQTITQTSRSVRILGSHTRAQVPCVALLTATGNNLAIRGDMVSRCVVCRIDPGVERPEARSIPQDLLAETTERRRELVSAAQTIVRAYLAAGAPDVGVTPLREFREWTRLVRAPLAWLGLPDPVETVERTREGDDSREALHAVLEAWHAVLGEEPVTAPQVVEKDDYRLHEALALVAMRGGKVEPNKLAYWLRQNRDSRAGPLVLKRAPGKKRPSRWSVIPNQ